MLIKEPKNRLSSTEICQCLNSIIKSIKKFDFSTVNNFARVALIDGDKKLLISGGSTRSLHICTLNGSLIRTFNPNNLLEFPLGLCTFKEIREEIYVGDSVKNRIFVFDLNFELKTQFGDENLKTPQSLYIDTEYATDHLYSSDTGNNEITIWNRKTGIFIDKIEIDSPWTIKFTKTSLFIESIPLNAIIVQNNKVERFDGDNCIFEVDKISFITKRRIAGDWFASTLLSIGLNETFSILAYSFDKNKIKSESKYLFKLDKNGNIMSEILLDSLQALDDSILIQKTLITILKTTIKIFELE